MRSKDASLILADAYRLPPIPLVDLRLKSALPLPFQSASPFASDGSAYRVRYVLTPCEVTRER